jgi:hypothetical protein
VPSPGIVAAPSTATIGAPPPGSAHCNSADVLAEDESAARILSADSARMAKKCEAIIRLSSSPEINGFQERM